MPKKKNMKRVSSSAAAETQFHLKTADRIVRIRKKKMNG